MMEMDGYQERTRETSIFEGSVEVILQDRSQGEARDLLNLLYVSSKLNGEAGELGEEVAKIIRDDYGEITLERREKIINELGDVLWYVARIADKLNIHLEEVAYRNLKKLRDRQERGKLHGSGSDR